MRIDHQVLTGVSTPARAAAAAQRWLVGQLLSIGVIGRVDESSMRLSIDGQEVLARTSLDLAPGSRLTARVVSAGAQPLLSIVDPRAAQTPVAGAPAATTTTIRHALSSTLPLQEPLDTVLTRLESEAADSTTPGTVQARAVHVTQALPDLPALSQPATLARAVSNAGQQLEATLAAAVAVADDTQAARDAHTAPVADLKFQLLGLREAIDVELARLPPATASPLRGNGEARGADATQVEQARTQSALRSLAQDVDAGVARITTHQLQHLAAADRGDFYVYTELPFRTPAGTETLTLSIDADEGSAARREDEARGSIALNLAVPLADVGELRARIGLAGDRLAVTLWSEEPALRELIVADIDGLERRLGELGFELTPIALREVAPPDPLRELPPRLIDTSI